MSSSWKHVKTIVDGEPFLIDGINIWEYEWKGTGHQISVLDPLYGQPYTVPIYELLIDEQTITFATTEFSNCVWGIYLPKA
jgi:hypothetical protein